MPGAWQQTQPTGVIAGALTSADSGQPVRRAEVQLASATPRRVWSTTSDGDGRFAFTALPAGEFTLSASRPGYLPMVFGARQPGPGRPGTPIRLEAGQRIEKLSLVLPRGGVIAGRVTDEYGDPAYNTPVRAMRVGYQNGFRALEQAGTGTTDDLGNYRIAGLLPGEYVVTAIPRDTVAARARNAEAARARVTQIEAAARGSGSGEARAMRATLEQARREGRDPTGPPDPVGYVPVYYAGGAAPSSAATVSVGLSQEVAGIDMRLEVVETAVVSGIVLGPDGAPWRGANVQLVDPAMPVINVGAWFATSGPDGRFSFSGVLPGTYAVGAKGDAPAGPSGSGELLMASSQAVAGPGGAAAVELRLTRGVEVSGRLRLETIDDPVDLSTVRIDLYPISTPADWEMPLPRTTPAADGRFVVSNVHPGRYRIGVAGLAAPWVISSAPFNGADVADHHLVVEPGRTYAGGTIAFTSRTADVSGTIRDDRGQPVAEYVLLLFPVERSLWLAQSRRIRTAQPAPDGTFRIAGLPSGTYRLAAVVDPLPGQEFDTAFLERLFSQSIEVVLGDGQSVKQDIQVR